MTTKNSVPTNGFAKDMEARMINHMNEDHVEAMRDYCRFADIEIGDCVPEMVGIDQDSFELLVNGKRVRFNFNEKCLTPQKVREALVELAETARMKR